MARRNLEVIVTVRDAASKPLKDVEGQLKKTGKSANDAGLDFIKFNKTLFTTTAFVGTFIKAFNTLNNALNQGAELDRLETQYERVLGPKGVLLDQIRGLTTTSVDEMEAMREGLKLSNLGLVQNSEQVADIMAKSATAAKLAGLDASEGMKKMSDFMTSGSVSNLEFLGILSRTNPALQAQLAILNKAGGIMGTVISTQQKLAIGMGLLNAAVKGQLKGTRDLADIMLDFKQNIDLTRKEIGRFLGAALGPLIDKFSHFLFNLRSTVSDMRKHEKSLVFLAKAFVVVTGAVTGLIGALGSLKLMVKLLGFAGIGLPGLSLSVLTLTGLFVGLTNSADSVLDRLKLFGAFIQGIYQLIESLDPETGFSKMDKSIRDMLQNAGLLTLAQNIARVGSIIKTVVQDSITSFNALAKFLDQSFGKVSKKIIGFLDAFKEPWNNWWVRDSISPIQKMIRSATVLIGGFFAVLAGKKLFGALSGILSKIPVIGGIFGGGGGLGSGPSGKSTDPIYVKEVSTGPAGLLGGAAKEGLSYKLGEMLGKVVRPLKDWLVGRLVGLSMMYDLIKTRIISAATAAFGKIGSVGGPLLAVALSGYLGYKLGEKINEAAPTTKNKYGQESNIFERLIAQGAYLTGQISKKQLYDMYYSSPEAPKTPDTGTKSTIAVPKMPDTQVDVVDALGEQLKSLEGDKRTKFQKSVEQALSSNSPGAGMVTPEEWRDAMVVALDESENLSILANKAKQNPGPRPPGSRRMSGPSEY